MFAAVVVIALVGGGGFLAYKTFFSVPPVEIAGGGGIGDPLQTPDDTGGTQQGGVDSTDNEPPGSGVEGSGVSTTIGQPGGGETASGSGSRVNPTKPNPPVGLQTPSQAVGTNSGGNRTGRPTTQSNYGGAGPGNADTGRTGSGSAVSGGTPSVGTTRPSTQQGSSPVASGGSSSGAGGGTLGQQPAEDPWQGTGNPSSPSSQTGPGSQSPTSGSSRTVRVPDPPDTSASGSSAPVQVPQRPQPPPYSGPSSGTIVWSGSADKGEEIVIEGGAATSGSVTGGLPGVACLITLSDPSVAVSQAPGPRNKYSRLGLRFAKKTKQTVVIKWEVIN